MDVAKLEKMKVVDLRNELQSRGLDTKGVKAVLIERLRAHVEGGAGEGGEFVCMRHGHCCVCVCVRVCVCVACRLRCRCMRVGVCVQLGLN